MKAEPKDKLLGLASVFPQCAQPGTRTKVKILGEYFDRAHIAVVNHPAMRRRVLECNHAKLEVALAVNVHAARGAHHSHILDFNILVPRGSSNARLFRIRNLRNELEHEPNSSFKQAEEVSAQVTTVFLSFPKGTNGLPPNQQVLPRRITTPSMQAATQKITTLERPFVGQRDINVNSWSPDSKRFAYISDAPAEGTAQ